MSEHKHHNPELLMYNFIAKKCSKSNSAQVDASCLNISGAIGLSYRYYTATTASSHALPIPYFLCNCNKLTMRIHGLEVCPFGHQNILLFPLSPGLVPCQVHSCAYCDNCLQGLWDSQATKARHNLWFFTVSNCTHVVLHQHSHNISNLVTEY